MAYPRPVEISLAHHGLLFLDELPEVTDVHGTVSALCTLAEYPDCYLHGWPLTAIWITIVGQQPNQQYQQAQDELKASDWAKYRDAQKALQATLQQLATLAGSQ